METVKLKFVVSESEKMVPGTTPAEGHIDLDLGATTVCAEVVSQVVAEDGCTVELELRIPDGTFPPMGNQGSFYSVKGD